MSARLRLSTRAAVVAFAALTLATASLGCSSARPLVASNGDLADYRAFRVAADPGTRLARAQAYLDAHPQGAWADEVRATFEAEEAAYFERAKTSRERARAYLVDLPRGPHADAAVVLLTDFDTKVDDVETARLLRDAQRTEAVLERAGAQRRAVGERILGLVMVLLDPAVYAASFDDAPAPLRRALDGPARRTWGAVPTRRSEDLFFSLPTQRERESRIALVTFDVASREGRVAEGTISGPDLFVRWLEADEMRARDASSPADRAAAAAHAAEVLGGALEATMPAAQCGGPSAPRGGAAFTRACNGLSVAAIPGGRAGDPDVIVVRGEKP